MSAWNDERMALSVALERSEAWLQQCRQVPRGLRGGMMEMLAFLLPEPRLMGALAKELRVTTAAVTQLADRAEKLGLVKRSLLKVDRRVVQLELTAEGRKQVMEVFSGLEVTR